MRLQRHFHGACEQEYLNFTAPHSLGTIAPVDSDANHEEKETNPDGRVIEAGQAEVTGKHASNGIEASKLPTRTKEQRETYAQDQPALAEDEPEPQEVHPWAVAETFNDADGLVKRVKAFMAQGRTSSHRIEFGPRARPSSRSSTIEYRNPEHGPLCKHLSEEGPASLAVNVSVVAKLSCPYYDYLRYEAKIYQDFPTRFFQHFTWFNQLRPLHNPFPVGALVPQFHGDYVLENSEDNT
ncbi:hypothetical protein FA13DRAFT_1793724 [Coprinellus micaceus]|uniref:Uncharacterized protein n=1 Tax=Coprinellus micaceus TaxID=71717 RepID=A0A4Y7T3X7_COPMI|nr:hypothetical protein FA13DRAFT_1793724 [Coprinellus micaceus]